MASKGSKLPGTIQLVAEIIMDGYRIYSSITIPVRNG